MEFNFDLLIEVLQEQSRLLEEMLEAIRSNKIVSPDSPKYIGKVPWSMRKSLLEQSSRLPHTEIEKDNEGDKENAG